MRARRLFLPLPPARRRRLAPGNPVLQIDRLGRVSAGILPLQGKRAVLGLKPTDCPDSNTSHSFGSACLQRLGRLTGPLPRFAFSLTQFLDAAYANANLSSLSRCPAQSSFVAESGFEWGSVQASERATRKGERGSSDTISIANSPYRNQQYDFHYQSHGLVLLMRPRLHKIDKKPH